jgi:hypothetical protein
MSFNILVIPEDPTYNGAILLPVVERVLAEVGKPNARIKILTDPAMKGIDRARDMIRGEIFRRWGGTFDLWLFIPDADRATGLPELEEDMKEKGVALISCAADPEVEAWACASYSRRLVVPWNQVSGHPRFKEEVFQPALKEFGDLRAADEGRGKMIQRALNNYRGLKRLCPEIAELEQRISEFLER